MLLVPCPLPFSAWHSGKCRVQFSSGDGSNELLDDYNVIPVGPISLLYPALCTAPASKESPGALALGSPGLLRRVSGLSRMVLEDEHGRVLACLCVLCSDRHTIVCNDPRST